MPSSLQMRRSTAAASNNNSKHAPIYNKNDKQKRTRRNKTMTKVISPKLQAMVVLLVAAWLAMTFFFLKETSSLSSSSNSNGESTDSEKRVVPSKAEQHPLPKKLHDDTKKNPILQQWDKARKQLRQDEKKSPVGKQHTKEPIKKRQHMDKKKPQQWDNSQLLFRQELRQGEKEKKSIVEKEHTEKPIKDQDIIMPDVVKNDIHTLWDSKRLFQQRLGGFRKIPPAKANKHSTRSHTFDGFNTSEKVLDMRNLAYTLPFDNPDGGAWKQGWNVEPKKTRPLTVYVLPHSHCDPGWIKTFDDYFQSQTKQILTTIVDALAKDERRKFIWAEISYFEWWWKELDPTRQELVRKLLRNKQLEFVTGGWVQPDEANTQLYAMEVQLQEGHDWIQTTFGEEYIPKYGWSIDPFGYSSTMPYLLKKFGFRAMLIQRVHYAVKKELASRQHLEFMWRQTWDDTGQHDVFTHVMPFFSYDVPHTCGPDPAVCCQFDFARHPMGDKMACPWRKAPKEVTATNVKERALLLLDQYEKKAALYRTNAVLVPLGDDFRYQTSKEAENQYRNYQTMFDYINENVDGVSIQFGTLSEYFEKVMGTFEAPLLKGSFFTYSDVNEDYWSGYYTSRVFDKALDRKLERVLFAATAMGATKQEMQQPRRALSLFQHHDGVTGTAKNHVVEDYAQRIHSAINEVQQWIIDKLKTKYHKTDMEACWKSDAPRGLSQNLCGNEGTVYLYNPLDTPQSCGETVVQGQETAEASLPCEEPGPLPSSKAGIVFDARTGLMTHPIKEEWMMWKVTEGGAYLFQPGTLSSFNVAEDVDIETGGYVVTTPNWKRRVVEREVPSEFGKGSTVVIDFVYETNLQTSNEEWFVRLSGDVANQGVFHTDLNGFNFDTHRFRDDMPIQSQVFPMPTLASIEDENRRITVLSEHAQGTASLLDGSIDVWLDRRLAQDDIRGLGQGVMDNVPTRTRLRVILETDGYATNGEFQPSPVCRRMWDELNHPMEMFGTHTFESAHDAANEAEDASQEGKFDLLPGDFLDFYKSKDIGGHVGLRGVDDSKNQVGLDKDGRPTVVVPFVFMVYKRVDYLQKAIQSLRDSDFDKSRTPLIISMDGHVPEMMEYVESLKSEFQMTVLTHPYSCHDHPDTFPGNDESLNKRYKGDTYGNKRSGWATCAKHHFAWMIQTVFNLNMKTDGFLFLEEDYVVAPTVYKTVTTGFYLLGKLAEQKHEFFGICLDPSEGHTRAVPYHKEGWLTDVFKSNPMALTRAMYEKFQANAKEFCTFDDYNWDWSIVHMMGHELLPAQVILPSIPQALHVGAKDGMHASDARFFVKAKMLATEKAEPFHGTKLFNVPSFYSKPKAHDQGYGGWGHAADQDHCMQVLQGKK